MGVLDDVYDHPDCNGLRAAGREPGTERGRTLLARGMNVGREHIAAVTNTLLLAYAGSGLPLLVILAAQGLPAGTPISFDSLATELVRRWPAPRSSPQSRITTALAALDAARAAQPVPPATAAVDVG
ncbi:MAG: YibE/F family protein [Dehalococcoidia bacterium]